MIFLLFLESGIGSIVVVVVYVVFVARFWAFEVVIRKVVLWQNVTRAIPPFIILTADVVAICLIE